MFREPTPADAKPKVTKPDRSAGPRSSIRRQPTVRAATLDVRQWPQDRANQSLAGARTQPGQSLRSMRARAVRERAIERAEREGEFSPGSTSDPYAEDFLETMLHGGRGERNRSRPRLHPTGTLMPDETVRMMEIISEMHQRRRHRDMFGNRSNSDDRSTVNLVPVVHLTAAPIDGPLLTRSPAPARGENIDNLTLPSIQSLEDTSLRGVPRWSNRFAPAHPFSGADALREPSPDALDHDVMPQWTQRDSENSHRSTLR